MEIKAISCLIVSFDLLYAKVFIGTIDLKTTLNNF